VLQIQHHAASSTAAAGSCAAANALAGQGVNEAGPTRAFATADPPPFPHLPHFGSAK